MLKLDFASWSWSDYALAGASLLALVKAASYLAAPTHRLPPSPPAEPIIGHARKIPIGDAHKTYAEWGKKYGMPRSSSLCIILLKSSRSVNLKAT